MSAIDNASGANPAGAAAPLTGAARGYALLLLTAVFTVSWIDRQVLNILAEPIKRDLHLADWQVGVMSGFAFALCYSTIGMPIARFSERSHRPRVIATAAVVWSIFTALCATAQSFVQLVMFRVGVGIGEAGCTPPAHSLIMDYVPQEKRASALSIYAMGVPMGALIGMALGGAIADSHGWRAAFLWCGLPGVLLAILVATTLYEPRRALPRHPAASSTPQLNFAGTLSYLFRKRSFWLMSLAASFKAFISYGHAPFTASYFYRVHGVEVASMAAHFGLKSGSFLGLALGLIGGLGGMLGNWIGGALADPAARTDQRAYAAVPAIATLLVVPLWIGVYLAPDARLALLLLAPASILASVWSGPTHAAILSLAPANMRTTTSSILLFMLNGIGLGLGPLCVGALSDVIAGPLGYGGAEGVRWALIAASLVGLAVAATFWAARKTLRDDIV
jgi:predicted MFS family arabinose efflux permease